MLAPLAVLLLFPAFEGAASSPARAVPAPTPARLIASCSAALQTKVEEATGLHFAPGVAEYSRLASACDYAAGDFAVRIQVQHLSQALDLGAEILALKTAFPDALVSEVTGLASRAIALEVPEAGTQLHILRGDREYLLVSVMGAGDGQRSFAVAARIARTLLGQ